MKITKKPNWKYPTIRNPQYKLLEKLSVSWKGVNTGLTGDFTHNPEPRPEHLEELAALLKSDSGFWAQIINITT